MKTYYSIETFLVNFCPFHLYRLYVTFMQVCINTYVGNNYVAKLLRYGLSARLFFLISNLIND